MTQLVYRGDLVFDEQYNLVPRSQRCVDEPLMSDSIRRKSTFKELITPLKNDSVNITTER